MMFPDNKKISNRQLFRLLCIDILGPAILLLPKVLAGYAGSYGVVCILLGCFAGFLYARLIIWLFMHKKEFYKYKLLKSVFSFGMAVISFGLFVFLVFVLSDLMKKNLSEIPFWIFFLCLCILSIYGISGGVEARARMFEFLFPWIWIPFVLMMVFGAFAIKPDFFYLPYVPSIKNVIEGSLAVFAFFLPLSYLLLRGEELTEPVSEWKKTVYKACFLSTVVLILVYLILLGCFGRGSLLRLDYPVVTLMSTIPMEGLFFQRLDAFMLSVWFFSFFSMILLSLDMTVRHLRLCKVFVGIIMVILMLVGCSGVQLEERCFPMLLGIDKTEDGKAAFCYTFEKANNETYGVGDSFLESRKDYEQLLHKRVDSNHLKVILIGEEYLEDDAMMEDMLETLTKEEIYPRNSILCVTGDVMNMLEVSIGEEPGAYIREYMDTHSMVQTTLGDLLNARDNGCEKVTLAHLEAEGRLIVEKENIIFHLPE